MFTVLSELSIFLFAKYLLQFDSVHRFKTSFELLLKVGKLPRRADRVEGKKYDPKILKDESKFLASIIYVVTPLIKYHFYMIAYKNNTYIFSSKQYSAEDMNCNLKFVILGLHLSNKYFGNLFYDPRIKILHINSKVKWGCMVIMSPWS